MADRTAARKKPELHHAEVVRTKWLTPHMVRVVLGGGSLAEFPGGEHVDAYVKLLFPVPGVTYPEPFDITRIRADFPRDQWPVTRTYTVRHWDPQLSELTLDFVVHGTEGLAGPWAAAAKPSDPIRFLGPGGAYSPSADAAWHLLAGDESALPAIGAALEHLPPGATAQVLLEISDHREEQRLSAPTGVEVTWLHRGSARPGELLLPAVRTLDFPAGRVHAFVHGEAGMVKELRRHLRLEREVPREDLSISGYWRLGHDESGWQASKKEWNAWVEAEQEGDRQPA